MGGLPTALPHGHSFGPMVDCPRSRKPATEPIVELAAGTILVVLVAVLGFGARPVGRHCLHGVEGIDGSRVVLGAGFSAAEW